MKIGSKLRNLRLNVSVPDNYIIFTKTIGTAKFIRRFQIFILTLSFVIGHLSFSYAIRPLYTEDCWVTSFGKPAIEIGGLLLTTRNNKGIKEFITSIKYGLTPNIDIGIDLPYFSHYSPEGNYDGMSDGTFKIKYNFMDNNNCNGLSFLVGYQLDTGDPNTGLGSNQHDITTMLIYSQDLGSLNYHLNFGYTFDDEYSGQPQEDFIIYNASIVKPLTDIINIMGEVQYSKNTYTGDIVGETAIGFNYHYNKSLIFDTAIGCGLNENSSSSNFTAGATILFD